MRIVGIEEIRRAVSPAAAIDAMREAVIAYSRGECETPMPMHLYLAKQHGGEVHMKSSFRKGGRYFALKMAGTFATRAYGMVMLVSAETGETAAYFDDGGYLTDLRTAAVSAMAARELQRKDQVLGILGTGIQARLQAELHAGVLPLSEILVWGRNPERAAVCVREISVRLPGVRVAALPSPAEVSARSRLIVTATASREPLLRAADVFPGTHISAVGADSPGKQELEPVILRHASLLLVDSLAQCEKLGELQHALSEKGRAVEVGAFCASHHAYDRDGVTVADFTGLGAEDLFVAEACLASLSP